MYIVCFQTICIATWFCSQSSRPRTLTRSTSTTQSKSQTTSDSFCLFVQLVAQSEEKRSYFNPTRRQWVIFDNTFWTRTLHYWWFGGRVCLHKENKPAMDITARVHKAVGLMTIHNPKGIRFSVNLVELLGVNPALKPITIIEKLNSPSTYFVHCDLIDKRQNLLNGKPSTVLARFDVRGSTLWKGSLPNTTTTCFARYRQWRLWVNSITLSVKDEKSNLFDFKGYSLEFELEIN